MEAEVWFLIQLLHIIHYHEREFNKQFERPFCLALIVQRQKNTQSTIWRKRKQNQVAMIRRFPGFYASGWLLKLQAELERVAKVRNFMLKSKWNVLDLSKFHPPNIVESPICLKCSGNWEQLGFNTSSPLFPCCQPSWGIPAKVLKLINTSIFYDVHPQDWSTLWGLESIPTLPLASPWPSTTSGHYLRIFRITELSKWRLTI